MGKTHRRCSKCNGRGKVLEEYLDWKGKPCCKDVKCDRCDGTGYELKSESGSDIIFPLDKKGK